MARFRVTSKPAATTERRPASSPLERGLRPDPSERRGCGSRRLGGAVVARRRSDSNVLEGHGTDLVRALYTARRHDAGPGPKNLDDRRRWAESEFGPHTSATLHPVPDTGNDEVAQGTANRRRQSVALLPARVLSPEPQDPTRPSLPTPKPGNTQHNSRRAHVNPRLLSLSGDP
jgi:hypothetical protein